MRPRTEAHLATAERNHSLAHTLLSSVDIQPPPLEWAVVVAFYAAVHYVNAYLWEKIQYAPRNHGERVKAIDTWAELKAISSSYLVLQDYSFFARYRANFRVSRSDAIGLIQRDLPAVQAAVLCALAPATP